MMTDQSRPAERPLTGKKVLLIAVAAFGTVIAANMTMMFAATGTFPGLVVKSAYVEGQGWNDRKAAQEALGWEAALLYESGALTIDLGEAAAGTALELLIGRPTVDAEDRRATVRAGEPLAIALAPGAWRIEMKAMGDAPYQAVATLFVPD